MIRPLLIILIVFTIFSCKKDESDDGIKPEDKQKAEALTAFLLSDQFRLKKYYSETPIDYIDTDQVVKSESDLWQYVSSWLHDDAYVFNTNGTVTIQQGPLKIPTDPAETVTRNYKAVADRNGVYFDFVGHEYQDLRYRLILFNDTMLRVSASWNGKTVISEYNALP